MQIRKLEENDLEDLIQIWINLMNFHKKIDPFFTRAYDGHLKFYDYIKSIISKENFCVIVGIENNKIIGYAITEITSHPPVIEKTKHCVITDIILLEEYRNKGYGKQLFEYLKNWAKVKGIDRLELQVAQDNTSAYEFYKKLGFDDYMHKMYLEI